MSRIDVGGEPGSAGASLYTIGQAVEFHCHVARWPKISVHDKFYEKCQTRDSLAVKKYRRRQMPDPNSSAVIIVLLEMSEKSMEMTWCRQTFSHDGHRALSSIVGWQAGRQFDKFLHLYAYIRLNHFPITVSKHITVDSDTWYAKKLADNLYAPDHQTHTTSQTIAEWEEINSSARWRCRCLHNDS